jgi:hypothetical protein
MARPGISCYFTCKTGGGTEFPQLSRCTTEASSKQLQYNVNGQAHKNSSYIYICDVGWQPAAANKGKYAQSVQGSGDSAEVCNTQRIKSCKIDDDLSFFPSFFLSFYLTYFFLFSFSIVSSSVYFLPSSIFGFLFLPLYFYFVFFLL